MAAGAVAPYTAIDSTRRVFSQTFTQLTILLASSGNTATQATDNQAIVVSGSSQIDTVPSGGYTFTQIPPVAMTAADPGAKILLRL